MDKTLHIGTQERNMEAPKRGREFAFVAEHPPGTRILLLIDGRILAVHSDHEPVIVPNALSYPGPTESVLD